jgi:ElaB/YqjD/DUF883 family membrane-anchored ribosome-binding protein
MGNADFAHAFEKLVPLIVGEWPDVQADALAETKGDYEAVVTLIARKTEHTRALVRRQLAELEGLARAPATGDGESNGDELQRLRKLVERIQERSREVSEYVHDKMLGDAEKKVRQNPLVALLWALGVGLLLGFILRGSGRGGRA